MKFGKRIPKLSLGGTASLLQIQEPVIFLGAQESSIYGKVGLVSRVVQCMCCKHFNDGY